MDLDSEIDHQILRKLDDKVDDFVTGVPKFRILVASD